jgi:hypothetical protein
MRKLVGLVAAMLTIMPAALVIDALVAEAQAVPVLASKAIDNDQVTVWDITLKQGQQGPATPADQDAVILYLEGGTIKSDSTPGSSTDARGFGDAVFVPKGSNLRETLVKGGPVHEVMIWLKNAKTKTIANSTKYPPAWPRPGAVKTLENDRVIAWNYSWLPDRPAPTHFHIHQQVVAYRYDGAIKTIAPDGTATTDEHKAGEIRFTEPNRTHSEQWDSGRMSAVVLELK